MDELEKRLAALRASSYKARDAATAPPPPPAPTAKERRPGDLERRLSELDPPTEEEESKPVVELKNVTDEEVASYLSQAASSPPSSLPAPPSSQSKQLSSALSALSALESVSPIEISYFSPSQPSRTLDEDEALIARLTDELSLEKSVASRGGGDDQDLLSTFEKRLGSLKEFKMADGSSSVNSKVTRGGPGGPPPLADLGEGLEELRRKARKSGGKGKKKRGSDSDSETESESDEDSDEEEENSD